MTEKNKILVKAKPFYIDSQSSPDENRFVFAYTVTITNVGSNAARLVSRHWLITDSNGKVQEVNGDGVVGEQPNLNPGETFSYTSGALIETPVGTMQGKYDLVADNGESFIANIPQFTLSIPRTLH